MKLQFSLIKLQSSFLAVDFLQNQFCSFLGKASPELFNLFLFALMRIAFLYFLRTVVAENIELSRQKETISPTLRSNIKIMREINIRPFKIILFLDLIFHYFTHSKSCEI